MESVPVEEQVVIGALRVGWAIESLLDKFAAEFGVTVLQYNVLRICYVRDVDGTGIPSSTFGKYLMRRVPDVSRMIDRLVTAGLFERLPSATDRRVVLIRLTEAGLDLIERTLPLLLAHNKKLFAHMSEGELEKLAKGLGRALEGVLSARDE